MSDLHELARWAKEHRKRLIFASGPGEGGAMEVDMSNAIAELIVTILAFAAQSRLVEQREKRASEPVRSPGYENVGTGSTYSEYWATATVGQRRKLPVDSEILAYAGRSHAFGAAWRAMSDFEQDRTPGWFARVHLEPKDLGSVDLQPGHDVAW